MASLGDRLFDPCERYRFDHDLGMRATAPSCVDCAWQYAERVCATFQARLLRLATCQGYNPESEVRNE